MDKNKSPVVSEWVSVYLRGKDSSLTEVPA